VLYLYFLGYENKVILIDEPELSLHPSWQNRVLKIYENFAIKNNCQVIIATHSPHIIGSAKNEYIRILRKKEDGTIEAIDNSKAHGRDINSILFDVMGEVAYRPREFNDKIDRLHIAIDDRNLEEAQERLNALKKDYGEEDEVVMEAQMLIDIFSRDE
jgi:predicted ATP-binding protein involved in virulence